MVTKIWVNISSRNIGSLPEPILTYNQWGTVNLFQCLRHLDSHVQTLKTLGLLPEQGGILAWFCWYQTWLYTRVLPVLLICYQQMSWGSVSFTVSECEITLRWMSMHLSDIHFRAFFLWDAPHLKFHQNLPRHITIRTISYFVYFVYCKFLP